MKLDSHITSEFSDMINELYYKEKEQIVYGTVQNAENSMILLDGAETPIPSTSAVMLADGDRVELYIRDHKAVVVSNITDPVYTGEATEQAIAVSSETIVNYVDEQISEIGGGVIRYGTDEWFTNGSYTRIASQEYIVDPDSFGSTIINQFVRLSFNQPVRVGDGVNCYQMFNGCSSLNSEVVIGKDTECCYQMFANAISFNSPVTIGPNVKNSGYMFNRCSRYNQPITIPSSLTNCSRMFENCSNFNQLVTLEESNDRRNILGIFNNCIAFNQPLHIPNNTSNCSGALSYCTNFDQQVTFSEHNSGLILNSFLSGCTKFNTEINIPYEIDSMPDMFYNCQKFDKPVTITRDESRGYFTNAYRLFANCRNFNSTLTIMNNAVVNFIETFQNCVNYNSPIVLPPETEYCNFMFNNCFNYNQPITIPEMVVSCNNMFRNCYNFGSDIYIKEKITSGKAYYNFNIPLPGSATTPKRIFKKTLSALPITISGSGASSVAGSIASIALTYEQIDNGYYNSDYNVYLLNNYED